MAEPTKKGFGYVCRLLFRWFRIFCLLLVLFTVCLVIYMTQVGLPETVKRPLLSELRTRGIDLQFERMRWVWFRGVIAENVTLGETNQTGGLQFKAKELAIDLDQEKLRDFAFVVRSLSLDRGQLTFPLNETNQPVRLLTVNDVSTEIHLLPEDQWELLRFKASTMGVNIALSASITNASHLRELTRKTKKTGELGPKKPKDLKVWREQLRTVVDTMAKMQFDSPPELYLVVRGDAKDAASFSAAANLDAKSAITPWGKLKNLSISTPLNVHELTNGLFQAEVKLRFDEGHTPWGEARKALVNVQLVHGITNPAPFEAHWDIALNGLKLPYGKIIAQELHLNGVTRRETNAPDRLQTSFSLKSKAVRSDWVKASGADLKAVVTSSLTNPLPRIHSLQLTLSEPQSRWVQAKSLSLDGKFAPVENPAQTNSSWGFWAKLAPYEIQWNLKTTDLRTKKLRLPSLATAGKWSAPVLVVSRLESALADGEADVALRLNVTNRQLWTRLKTDIDIQKLAHLMSTNTQQWMGEIKWEKAPILRLEGRMELPGWTAQDTNWDATLLHKTWVAGDFSIGDVSYQNLSVHSLQTDFEYTNGVVAVTNLHLLRPEGELQVAGHADFVKEKFTASLHSSIDPLIIRPFIKQEKTLKVIDEFKLTTPPHLTANVQATWSDWNTLQADGRLLFTNFSYSGHGVSNLNANVRYADKFILVRDVDIRRNATENATASAVGLDLLNQMIHITNGLTHWDVEDATGIIGPVTQKAVEPYHFSTPPTVRVNGLLPFHDAEHTDLHFVVLQGGHFNYWRFNLMQVTGVVHWVTNTLTLTNIDGEFYGGRINGNALFDFAPANPTNGTDYSFHAIGTNFNLHPFMLDMLQHTNTLEGNMDCDLTISSANSRSMSTWNGFGTASMKDGFLWDIPLMGKLTKVLEGINEGLGKSRVREGTASYYITNSVIYTTDLELKTPSIRLQYRGSVDFDAKIDAKVEAQLFRDSNLLLRVISPFTTPFTKLLEYKVTGTLGEPKMEPLYIPKILLFPLQPFKTLKGLFEGGKKKPEATEPAPAAPPDSQKEKQ